MKSTIYDGKVYDYKTDKYISFDEFKAQQDSDIDIALNLESEQQIGK